jgi:SdpC family antimicrobial peptide
MLLVVGLTVPPGLAFGNPATQAAQQPAGSKYDGEAIFRGLYFGQGPVADLFPELWKQQRYLDRKKLLTQEDERRMGEIREKIIAGLKAKDRAFFDTFASTLRSGDHLAIQKKVAEVTDLTLDILQKDTGKDATAPIVDLAGVYRYVYFWQYLYLYFYVYVYEFVLLVIYFAPLLDGPVGGLATTKGISRLQREQWIDMIVKRLGKS